MGNSRMATKKNTLIRSPGRLALLVLCGAISAVASPNFAQAQQWKFEPIIRVGGEYDDNARLSIRTDEEISLSGLLLDLKADIDYSSARTSFSVQPRALLKDYPDDPDFDSDDFFLRSQFRHRGQLNTIGFRSSFEHESVRTAERIISDLEIDDPDEITADDSGRILLTGTRNKWRISPYWDHRLSDISSIGARLDYFNVQYDDVFAGFLTDYSDTRLNLNYRRTFSNVNTGLLTVTARNYDAVNATDDTNGYGVMTGFEHALSQKMRLTAMIGLEDTQQPGSGSDPEAVGHIRLTRNLETIRMFAQYRRSVSGSGAGGLSARDSFDLNFLRRLNEKISAGLGVRAYRVKGTGGSTTVDDRNYLQLQSSFRWYLTRAFVIEADYRYTVNDRSAAIGERSNSSQVNLWFVYQPKTTPKL